MVFEDQVFYPRLYKNLNIKFCDTRLDLIELSLLINFQCCLTTADKW